MEPLHERTFNPLPQIATLLQFESPEYNVCTLFFDEDETQNLPLQI